MKPFDQENESIEEPQYVDLPLTGMDEIEDWKEDAAKAHTAPGKSSIEKIDENKPDPSVDEIKDLPIRKPSSKDKRLFNRQQYSAGSNYIPSGRARKAPVEKAPLESPQRKESKTVSPVPHRRYPRGQNSRKNSETSSVKPPTAAKMLPALVKSKEIKASKQPSPVDKKIRPVAINHPKEKAYRPESKPRVTVSVETLLPEWYVLEDIISKHQPLPEGSVILGIDESGKPLVIALEDHSFGSFLFMGDSAGANRKHLLSVLASAESLNQPEILQIDVITPKPEGYASKRSNLRQICNVSDDCIFNLLGDYLTTVEQRLRDERQLPFQLLVLDQIETLTSRLAEESLRFLRWIIRRGPQVGIWPLASIDSEKLAGFDLKTYKAFGFHLYGKMTEEITVNRFTSIPPKLLRALSPGSQGCFKLDEEVVSFSIPEVAQ